MREDGSPYILGKSSERPGNPVEGSNEYNIEPAPAGIG
jgi:hypothetical protein